MSPYFIPAILGNFPASHISRKFSLRGPISSPSLACATGSYAIGEAFRVLQRSTSVYAILAGATEAPLHAPSYAGFSSLRALSRSKSSPFDQNRDGFVLGEGAGCVVLESLDSALQRKAKIYAEIIGFGNSSDGFHPTAPDPTNSGAIKAINAALNIPESFEVVAVNAHATSTRLGDELELSALEKCLKPQTPVVSNKGAIGHLLGASGAVESIFTVLSLKANILPSNLNLTTPIPTSFTLPIINTALSSDNAAILKTSFGFGGVNVALLFKRYNQ